MRTAEIKERLEVTKFAPVGGWDSKMEPLARYAIELLRATGHTLETIRRVLEMRTIMASQLIELTIGRVVLVELTIDKYDGREMVVARRFLPATAMRLPKDWTAPTSSSESTDSVETVMLALAPADVLAGVKQLGDGGASGFKKLGV